MANQCSTKKDGILGRFVAGLTKNPIAPPSREVILLLFNNREIFETVMSVLLENGNGSIKQSDLKFVIQNGMFEFLKGTAEQKKISIEEYFIRLINFAGFNTLLITLNGRDMLVYNPGRLFL